MITEYKCPVCHSNEVIVFFETSLIPANIAILWSDRDSAINCSKGDLKLGFCKICSMIWNMVFDTTKLEYSEDYDNSLHFSKVYDEYARSVAMHLIDQYEIYDKKIVEIGCGKGDFLIMLCEMGKNTGFGFDTSYVPRKIDGEVAKRLTFIKDFYSEEYSNYYGDLVCSRYVLEHIENPVEFLKTVRQNIGNRQDSIVYFEVPNVYLILEKMSVWDIIYEHCLYFSPGSLAFIFEMCGFRVNNVKESYGNQFVSIEAVPIGNEENDTLYNRKGDQEKIVGMVETFNLNYLKKMEIWRRKIQIIENEQKRTILWGAGAKSVSFLNMFKIEKSLQYVVDINPNKHGKYIAGTGQRIVPPDFIREFKPDSVLIMNPMYEAEIRSEIKEMIGDVEVLIV